MPTKRKLGNLYKKHKSIREWVCYYCGDYGGEIDHVPPVSWRFLNYEKIIVRCCWKCNQYLSDKMLFTLKERKEEIDSLKAL